MSEIKLPEYLNINMYTKEGIEMMEKVVEFHHEDMSKSNQNEVDLNDLEIFSNTEEAQSLLMNDFDKFVEEYVDMEKVKELFGEKTEDKKI